MQKKALVIIDIQNYKVNVLSDCITSWDKKQIPEMLKYYEKQGSRINSLNGDSA